MQREIVKVGIILSEIDILEKCTGILKIAVECREDVGVFPLPSHLTKIASISSKVPKKAIMIISGRNDVLHESSGHGYSGKGPMKLSMTNPFFCLECTAKIQVYPCIAMLKNFTLFQVPK